MEWIFLRFFLAERLEICCVNDTAQTIMETRPEFVNSNSTLLELYKNNRFFDRIFLDNFDYELYVHYERNYVPSAQDADIVQVRERINSIPR